MAANLISAYQIRFPKTQYLMKHPIIITVPQCLNNIQDRILFAAINEVCPGRGFNRHRFIPGNYCIECTDKEIKDINKIVHIKTKAINKAVNACF